MLSTSLDYATFNNNTKKIVVDQRFTPTDRLSLQFIENFGDTTVSFDQQVQNNRNRSLQALQTLDEKEKKEQQQNNEPLPFLSSMKFPLLQDSTGTKNCDPFRMMFPVPVTTAPQTGLPGRSAI
jgi:hypothetical protein